MKHIYTFICLFLLSGVANADSMMTTLLFSDPAASFLLTIAEVSVAMTAFGGIVIVIGRRGSNKWTEFDVMRFTTLTVNGVMAVVFWPLPFLLFNPYPSIYCRSDKTRVINIFDLFDGCLVSNHPLLAMSYGGCLSSDKN